MRRPGAALLLCVATLAGGGAVEDRFAGAGHAYEAGDFAQAEIGYRALLEEGARAPEVYYNLGSALYRQGKLGAAILSYERALRLDPGDADTLHNLEHCRQQIADRDEPPRHWTTLAYQAWSRRVGSSGEAWILLSLYLPGMAALGVWVLHSGERVRRAARFAAVLLLTLALPAAALVGVRAAVESGNPEAVVLADKVEGRSGPGADNAVLFSVHEGLKVQVRNRAGDWVQVLLPNGLNGWVPDSALETI